MHYIHMQKVLVNKAIILIALSVLYTDCIDAGLLLRVTLLQFKSHP